MKSYVLALLPLILSAASAQEPQPPKGFSALARTPAITIEELRKDPDKQLGLRVKLSLVFGQETEIGNPYFTRFVSSRYARFTARSASAPLWEPQILANEFSYLFVAKDSPFLASMRGAKSNQRIEATVVVRDSFRNIPWIEVVDLKLKPEWVPEGTLIAVARGKRLREEGQRHLALEQFQKALVEPLPVAEKVALLKEMAALHKELEEAAKAKQLLEQALALAPQDASLQEALKN